MSFVIQRYLIIREPTNTKLKSISSTYLIILIVTGISFILNSWVLFFFELNTDQLNALSKTKVACGLISKFKNKYINHIINYNQH